MKTNADTLLNIEDALKKLIGHKVTLHFTPHEESELRESSGILVVVTPDIIHLKIYDNYGEPYDYYLNRHACTLHSVTDEGKPKDVS